MQMPGVRYSINAFFDFILPRICPCCQRKLSAHEEVICKICLDSIEEVSEEKLCEEYNERFHRDGIISGIVSSFIYEKESAIQDLIHSAKYHKRFQNAFFLGKLLGRKAQSKLTQWQVDLIIPVPLHSAKKAERGYNQSYYISKGISRVTGISVCEKAVKRVRNTQSQTHLNLIERKMNVKGAFKIKSADKIKNKNILIVDDVITSGSTISECAAALKNSGADNIYVASAAIVEN